MGARACCHVGAALCRNTRLGKPVLHAASCHLLARLRSHSTAAEPAEPRPCSPPPPPPTGYVFFLAPNQTPTIDAFIVQKLVGLKQEDPYQVGPPGAAAFRALTSLVGAGRAACAWQPEAKRRAAAGWQRRLDPGSGKLSMVNTPPPILLFAGVPQVNTVFAAVFNAMGLYPLIYASLLIPAARSNRVRRRRRRGRARACGVGQL